MDVKRTAVANPPAGLKKLAAGQSNPIAVASLPVELSRGVASSLPADSSSRVAAKWVAAMAAANQNVSIPSIDRSTRSRGELKSCSGWTNVDMEFVPNAAASNRPVIAAVACRAAMS